MILSRTLREHSIFHGNRALLSSRLSSRTLREHSIFYGIIAPLSSHLSFSFTILYFNGFSSIPSTSPMFTSNIVQMVHVKLEYPNYLRWLSEFVHMLRKQDNFGKSKFNRPPRFNQSRMGPPRRNFQNKVGGQGIQHSTGQ